jgi:DNA polymerase-3 subunit epsilon
MIVAGLDLETTGVKLHRGDKIIEVCISTYDLDDEGVLTLLGTYTQRVNPLRSIAVEAQRVHGISLEDLRDMPTWPEIAPKIKTIIEGVDLLVIHNRDFDLPFVQAEQNLAGHQIEVPNTFCTMVNGRWATFDGKTPKLGELCWTLSVDYDASVAHAAEYDVQKMMECFSKGLRLGLYQLEKGE